MKTILVTLSFLIFANLAGAAPKRGELSIQLRQSDTLYVEFTDMINSHGVGQNDRFRHFKTTLEKVFEEVKFPMEYKIVRFGANSTPPGHPRLSVTMTKWGYDGMSEIEVRLGASIRYDVSHNRLGSFYARGGTSFGTGDQMVRIYNEVLSKALVKVVAELNGRLIIGDSPADELAGAAEGEAEEEN